MRKHILVRVLFVGDDPDIRAVLRAACRDEGWETLEAEQGADGLALLRVSAAPTRRAARLSNARDGWVAGASGGAAHPTLQRHTYLLITANPMTLPPDLPVLAQRLGIPILAKPFDLDEVVDAIECAAARTLPRGGGRSLAGAGPSPGLAH